MHENKQKWQPTQTIAKSENNNVHESNKTKENASLK